MKKTIYFLLLTLFSFSCGNKIKKVEEKSQVKCKILKIEKEKPKYFFNFTTTYVIYTDKIPKIKFSGFGMGVLNVGDTITCEIASNKN